MTLTLANHDFWKTVDNSREFQVQNRMALMDGSTFDLVDLKTGVTAFYGRVYNTGVVEIGNMTATGQTNIVQYAFIDNHTYTTNLILKPNVAAPHIPVVAPIVAGVPIPPDPVVFINDGEEPPASYDNHLSIYYEQTKVDPNNYVAPTWSISPP